MKSKNKITKNLVYLLVGAIILYGVGVAAFGNLGETRFDFSDGDKFKQGLFATDPVNKFSESWIQWDIVYSNGDDETGRTGKNQDVFGLTLVKSIEDQRIMNQADFVVYSDFSQIGNKLCIDTPRMTIKQTVTVNGIVVDIPKQTVLYNEIDERNILKGIGVRITPQFFEGQIMLKHGPLDSGDEIKLILDANGRFELTEVNPSTGNCLSTPIADGFIEGIHAEYSMVFGDPLDILLGTFPFEQTEITDQPVTIDICKNGQCSQVVIEEAPDSTTDNADQTITGVQDTELSCITIYEPVCAANGVSYSNQCVADSFGVNTVYEGVCVGEVISDLIDPSPLEDNPTGINGVVGFCDPLIADCSLGSPDIEAFVERVQANEFAFNSFEFIMLSIIAIIILVIIISRVIGKRR